MVSDGRIEKRATVKVPVHIVPVENSLTAETTTMINVSRRGARVLTGRRWRPGEVLGITSMTGEFRRQGTVIYCHPVADSQFCLGMEFTRSNGVWKDTPWLTAT
ncbi:MAG: PilZ domain-containing protein [Candidatus Acidiferrales bacterium]